MGHACFGNYKDDKNCRNCIDVKGCREAEPIKVVVKKKGRPAKKTVEEETVEESIVDEAEAMAKEAIGE